MYKMNHWLRMEMFEYISFIKINSEPLNTQALLK